MTLRAKLRRNRVLAWLWRGLSRLSRPASPARMVTDNDAYLGWIQQFERPSSFKIQAADPLISIIVPVFNTTELLLTELVASVTNQTYDRWELVLADGSDDDAARKRCAAATTSDRRIKHLPLPNNAGIAGNTNAGIAAATGSFIAFLDHDDTLAPFALAAVVTALRRQPGLDVFYSDEDKLMADGTTRLDPLFKPDWSPDLFLAANYLAHFVVVRAELVRHIGGIRMGYDGAQDHDFLLRVFDLTDRIHHIPQLSYHWRATEGSTAQHPSEKSDAASAGSRVLAEYLTRNHIKGRAVDMDGQLTNYRLSYQAPPKARLRVAVLGGGEPPA